MHVLNLDDYFFVYGRIVCIVHLDVDLSAICFRTSVSQLAIAFPDDMHDKGLGLGLLKGCEFQVEHWDFLPILMVLLVPSFLTDELTAV